jgi:hypothetical protein
MSTNDPLNKEIAGTHYKEYKMQPIELIVACKWDFIQGNIAKYLLRAIHKNGQEDIDKAVHYCELGRMLQDDDECIDNTAIIHSFIRINSLNEDFWSKVFYMINKKNYFSLFAELIRKENVKKYLLQNE